MNIFLLKTILCAFISIVTVVGALSVQSCSNDFENSFEKKNDVKGNRYLDISNDTSQKNKLDILNKAFQRIGTQFVIKDDTCYLTVHSEKKLNMSSDVFALVRQSIEAANKQYDMFLLFKDNNMGIKIKNPFDLKLSITATRIEREISDGPNYSTTKLILSNSETITVLNEMRCANGLSTATTGLVTSGFIGPVLGSLLIVYRVC